MEQFVIDDFVKLSGNSNPSEDELKKSLVGFFKDKDDFCDFYISEIDDGERPAKEVGYINRHKQQFSKSEFRDFLFSSGLFACSPVHNDCITVYQMKFF